MSKKGIKQPIVKLSLNDVTIGFDEVIPARGKKLETVSAARLIETIYDDAAEAYKNACETDDKQRQQVCLAHLLFIETLFKEQEFWTMLGVRN